MEKDARVGGLTVGNKLNELGEGEDDLSCLRRLVVSMCLYIYMSEWERV